MPEQTPFCPACGAPQIRVTQSSEAGSNDARTPITTQTTPLDSPSSGDADTGKTIQWRRFLRIAWPLAAITGAATVFSPSLGFVVLLPASIVWAISRYRQIHLGRLNAALGARLGAAVGLLSFSLVIVLLLADLAANSKEFQREMAAKIGEFAASNTEPQAQAFLQWASTTTGVVVLTALGMAMFLVLFVGFASFTGAMVAYFSRNKDLG